ncbi:MAG: cysteine desulfurase family protein [Pirellulales bacterium]
MPRFDDTNPHTDSFCLQYNRVPGGRGCSYNGCMVTPPRMLYLDHNATTPLLPRAALAMRHAEQRAFANPASQHAAGRQARLVVEETREQIMHLLGAGPQDQLVFTSGGTEANNLALLGMARAAEQNSSVHRRSEESGPLGIVISSIEHPSVIGAADELSRRGWEVARLPVDANGVIQLAAFEGLLTPSTRLVSVMLGNNETGVLQPLHEIAATVRAAESRFGTRICLHADAVQAVGKVPVDFLALGVDALSFTAHKLHGPRGIGGLLLSANTPIAPMLHGGFQQAGLRPGTESPELAAGLAAALADSAEEGLARTARMTALRDRFENGVVSVWPSAVVNGAGAARLPHTSNVAFPGIDRQALLMALDLAGVCCSTGSACASGSSEPSPVLLAMGCPPEIVGSSLRFSLGALTSESDIDEAILRLGRTLACWKGASS